MQVRGPAVVGGLLDEDFSGLRDVVVVDDVGLITCEGVVGQSAQPLIRGSAQGISLEPTHIEDEDEDQENEKEDERDCEECKQSGEAKRIKTHNHMKHG